VKGFAVLLVATLTAGPAGAQGSMPGMPVPRGKDSAAVAALFARHMKATGSSVASQMPAFMHFKQQMEMNGSPPMEMEGFMIRPAPGTTRVRVRSLMNMPMMGMMETVVNGNDGWLVSAAGPPMLLTPEQVKQVVQNGNPDPLTSMPQAKLSVVPRTTIDGREMDGVRFVDTLGTDAVMYFEVKSGLASAVRSGSTRGMAQDTSMVMLMGDYKSFNGSLMPTSMSIHQGGAQTMVMRMTTVEFTPIDTMMFVPPAAVVELLKQKKP